MEKIGLDLVIGSVSLTFLVLSGGLVPLIASILSILWLAIRFLDYIDKNHNKSFCAFFKWAVSWLKKN